MNISYHGGVYPVLTTAGLLRTLVVLELRALVARVRGWR